MPKSCTPWKAQHRPSGAKVLVRACGANRAEIVGGDGYYTYNAYHNGKWIGRHSARTLKAAKTAATRKIK